MKKLYALLLLFVISGNATNYYVSQLNGQESNNGLSFENAFLRIQQAHDVSMPGDTIFIMNGTYTNSMLGSDILEIVISGTENQWITYKNFENHQPILQLNENNWQGISIQGADYINIEGLKIIGNNDSITLDYALSEQYNLNNPATSGNGISISVEYANQVNKSHHITITNCEISKCGGGGIYTYQTDYITIENNTIFETAWFSPYNNSAITMYQNWNSDTSREIKNTISGNTCYRNETYVPSTFENVTAITGGNGIMIDDTRNTQFNSTLGSYFGKTNIVNNVIFDNGGKGIHSYSSDNIFIVNNTLYKNCQSNEIQEGELTAYESSNINVINNIIFPNTNIPPIANYNTTDLVVDFNLWGENQHLAEPFGTNTLIGNPEFVFPSNDFFQADFSLLSTSIAINAGILTYSPAFDKAGNPRIDTVDIGAYEFQPTLNNVDNNNNNNASCKIFPNPTKDFITLNFYQNPEETSQIIIYNSLGQKTKLSNIAIEDQSSTINVSDLSNGIYFIAVLINGVQVLTSKFIKI
ncbi:T9SS type A sorting domain-containing protein [Flavobacterium sp.]